MICRITFSMQRYQKIPDLGCDPKIDLDRTEIWAPGVQKWAKKGIAHKVCIQNTHGDAKKHTFAHPTTRGEQS